jgi:hypothetical protein
LSAASHFDHKYQKVRKWAADKFEAGDNLVLLLNNDEPWITRLVAMRNAIEHPRTEPRAPLTVRNFSMCNATPPWEVAEPSWCLTAEPAASIAPEMDIFADNLLTLYEDIVVDSLMRRRDGFPIQIVEIPEAERVKGFPIRLRVTFPIQIG